MSAGGSGRLNGHRDALPQPGFGEALLLLMVMFTATGAGLIALLVGRREAELDIALLGAVELLALLFGLVAGLRISRTTWREAFLPRSVAVWMLPVTLLVAGGAAIAGSALEGLITRMVPVPDLVAVEMARLLYAADTAAWIWVVLMVVVAIPLGEELFFRGLLLRGFLLRYGERQALILTSLLFAIVHLNPWGLPSIFLMGLLLGWLVLRTGSIWSAWLVHAVYNLASVLALNAALDGPPSVESLAAVTAGPLDSPLALAVAGAAILLGLGLLAAHGRRAAPWVPEPASGAPPWDPAPDPARPDWTDRAPGL